MLLFHRSTDYFAIMLLMGIVKYVHTKNYSETIRHKEVVYYSCRGVVCSHSRLYKADKVYVLNMINEFRNNVAGGLYKAYPECVTNINKVMWNQTLAIKAQKMINTCPRWYWYNKTMVASKLPGPSVGIKPNFTKQIEYDKPFQVDGQLCDEFMAIEYSGINDTNLERVYNLTKYGTFDYIRRGQMEDFWAVQSKPDVYSIEFRRAEVTQVGCGYMLQHIKQSYKGQELLSYFNCIYCPYKLTKPRLAQKPCKGCMSQFEDRARRQSVTSKYKYLCQEDIDEYEDIPSDVDTQIVCVTSSRLVPTVILVTTASFKIPTILKITGRKIDITPKLSIYSSYTKSSSRRYYYDKDYCTTVAYYEVSEHGSSDRSISVTNRSYYEYYSYSPDDSTSILPTKSTDYTEDKYHQYHHTDTIISGSSKRLDYHTGIYTGTLSHYYTDKLSFYCTHVRNFTIGTSPIADIRQQPDEKMQFTITTSTSSLKLLKTCPTPPSKCSTSVCDYTTPCPTRPICPTIVCEELNTKSNTASEIVNVLNCSCPRCSSTEPINRIYFVTRRNLLQSVEDKFSPSSILTDNDHVGANLLYRSTNIDNDNQSYENDPNDKNLYINLLESLDNNKFFQFTTYAPDWIHSLDNCICVSPRCNYMICLNDDNDDNDNDRNRINDSYLNDPIVKMLVNDDRRRF